MPTIEKGKAILTLVNVFTVAPEKQAALVELLAQATEQTMKNLPGFVSASIHRSLDGTRVVNYAQWQSLSAFQEMKEHPEAGSHMRAAAALAQFDPILCEVSESYG